MSDSLKKEPTISRGILFLSSSDEDRKPSVVDEEQGGVGCKRKGGIGSR